MANMTSITLLWITVLTWTSVVNAVEPGHEDRTEPAILESPEYPRPYPKGAEDSWTFERQDGVWAVVFEDLDVELTKECKDDYLLIRDQISNRNLVRACGEKLPSPVYSSGRKLLISFHSDELNEGRGFKIRVLHDISVEALKTRLMPPTTSVIQVPAEPVHLSRDDVMILSLSLALLVVVMVLICLSGWIAYHHCCKQGHSSCCACSRSSKGNHVVLNVEPRVVKSQSTRYTRNPPKKEPPTDCTGNGSPNVYIPMPDTDTPDQPAGSSLQSRQGTNVTSQGQLPLYHTPTSQFEEVKFIGVM